MPVFSTRRLIFGLATAGLAFNAPEAGAELLRYNIEGIITSELDLPVSVIGETFEFEFLVDTDLLTETSAGIFEGSIGSFTANVTNSAEQYAGSGGTFYADTVNFGQIFDIDFGTSDGATFSSVGSIPADLAGLYLYADADLFTLDRTASGLPVSLDPLHYSSTSRFWIQNDERSRRISASLNNFDVGGAHPTRFEVTVVPEPTSAAALGLSALALLRRKKKFCRGHRS